MSERNLTFNQLRAANAARLPLFKNKHGDQSHPGAVVSEFGIANDSWTPSDWVTALVGELGELANLIKKVRRGDFDMESIVVENGKTMTMRQWIAKELADTQCYLDLLSASLGVDLGQATVDKFNEISDRIGVDVKL